MTMLEIVTTYLGLIATGDDPGLDVFLANLALPYAQDLGVRNIIQAILERRAERSQYQQHMDQINTDFKATAHE